MPKDDDWISAAVAQIPDQAPLAPELKPVLEKLLRENLSSEPLKQGQLRGIAMRLTKFVERPEGNDR